MGTGHRVDAEGTAQVPSFDMPFSSLATREARDAYVRGYVKAAEARATAADAQPPPSVPADIEADRKKVDQEIVFPLLAKQQARWPGLVDVEPNEIDGVYTEVFTPTRGVADANRSRVLINVHGGGFMVGARAHGQLESIPIAALGEIRVVSVDYRMAPEYAFPAASEDLATVYENLLADYEPNNIGIYGSSAGGMLTAQAVPWFLEHNLPLPGAVGMLGATGQSPFKGDSMALACHVFDGAETFRPESEIDVLAYFAGADIHGRLAAPMLWPEVLAQFPPSLLVTGARALEMSSVIDAHNKLALAGARSRLHLWDGLGHCFYLDSDLPESREVEQVIVEFFLESLGDSR
jgi:acetyl esterase/lipase